MAKVKYDVVGVESGGNFEVPPTGVYAAILSEVKETESKGGTAMLECIYELSKGDFKGAKFWDYIVLTEEAKWKLRQFLEAVGLVKEGSEKKAKGSLDTDALDGTEVNLRLKHETYEGEKRAKIATVLPPGAVADTEEDLDDEGDGDPDDEYTYEEIMEMDLDELKEVIDEEELEVKVTKRSKVDTVREKVAEELELEEEAASGDDDDDDSDDDDYTVEEIEAMDLDELKEVIEEEELDIKVTKRSKAEKVAEKVIEELEIEEAGGDDDADGDDDDAEQDYSEMSAAELKAECKERGLKATGKTSVLIARLEKDDEEDDDPFA